MKDVPYEKKISPHAKALIIIIGLFFIGIVVGFLFAQIGISEAQDILRQYDIDLSNAQERQFATIYLFSIVIIVISLALLIGLLIIYIDTYRKTKSSFMLGLILFISVLFVRSLLSLFIVHALVTRYIRAFPLIRDLIGNSSFGGLSILIYIFEIVALSILLYLSME